MASVIGEAIKKSRLANQLSQAALGNKFKPQKLASEISRWENGRAEPSAKNVCQLLCILGDSFKAALSE